MDRAGGGVGPVHPEALALRGVKAPASAVRLGGAEGIAGRLVCCHRAVTACAGFEIDVLRSPASSQATPPTGSPDAPYLSGGEGQAKTHPVARKADCEA